MLRHGLLRPRHVRRRQGIFDRRSMTASCAARRLSTLTPPPVGGGVSADPVRFLDACETADGKGRRVVLIGRSQALRRQAEACIKDVYRQAFGAQNLVLPSTLIALVAEPDRVLCAAGLRVADEGFFSEVYLDRPIEEILSSRSGTTVARNAIFEVTTLASCHAEASTLFLRQLAVLGTCAGFRWAFFTATARLRSLLRQLGIPIFEMAPADPSRLVDADRWGSYYAHAPQVCAVEDRWIAEALPRRRVGSSHA